MSTVEFKGQYFCFEVHGELCVLNKSVHDILAKLVLLKQYSLARALLFRDGWSEANATALLNWMQMTVEEFEKELSEDQKEKLRKLQSIQIEAPSDDQPSA